MVVLRKSQFNKSQDFVSTSMFGQPSCFSSADLSDQHLAFRDKLDGLDDAAYARAESGVSPRVRRPTQGPIASRRNPENSGEISANSPTEPEEDYRLVGCRPGLGCRRLHRGSCSRFLQGRRRIRPVGVGGIGGALGFTCHRVHFGY